MEIQNCKALNVLVVEDSEVFMEWIINKLQELDGVKIISKTDNVDDAIDFVNENKVDIAILDIKLHKRLGTEILTHIKNNNYETKVIMFSNYCGMIEYCKDMGADHFFSKSDDFDKLIKTVSKYSNNLILN